MSPPDRDRRAPEPPLVSACSWCQSEGKGPPPGPGQTHGICPACAEGVLAEVEDRT